MRIHNIAPHDDGVVVVNAAVKDDDTGGAVGDDDSNDDDDEARASNLTIAGSASSAVTAYEFLCGLKHPRQLSDILQANSDFEAEYAWAMASSLLDKQKGVPSTTFDFADRVRSSYTNAHRKTNSAQHGE